MHRAQIFIQLVWLSAIATVSALGADGLTVTANIVGARYCLERNGQIGLKLRVDFTYQNAGEVPAVLPRFSRLSGYTLFRDNTDFKAHKAMARVSFPLDDIFRTLKLDPSKPSPLLFEPISPGGKAIRTDEVSIPLGVPTDDKPGMFGLSPLFQFALDNWPGHQHIESSRDVWQPLGALWASQDTAPVVQQHIEKSPVAKSCPPRVD